MSHRVEAIVEPELLVWARKTSGLDTRAAAGKIGIAVETLEEWEEGESRPSVARLRSMASAYKRPLAIFYLPAPPTEYQPLTDYRRVPSAELGKVSAPLSAFIRRAHAIREAAMDLRALADEPTRPAPHINVPAKDSELFANAARALLDVPLDRQIQWKDPGRALNGWIHACTQLDVLVLQVQAIDRKEMRGMSIYETEMPIIALNGADSPRGKVFTLAHEFAHLLLHNNGLCDVLPRRASNRPSDVTEIFCNRVAAALLLPADRFGNDALVSSPPSDGRWPEGTIDTLSGRYCVSREVVVRRLYTLKLTTWDFLQEKQAEYAAAYEGYRERLRRKRKESGKKSGPPFYRMKVRDLSRGFVESSLEAYHRRAITGSDLTEYLEIKTNQIGKLETELAQTHPFSE